jgi:transcriptional regulator with XRE-family HTH domain
MRELRLSPDAGPVAREVYRRMGAMGLGQKALALRAGLNETYVRDLFRGKSKNPKNQQLSKIAKALGCTLNDLTNPRGAENIEENEKSAQSSEEVALLRVWRRASPTGRDRITEAIEQAMLGGLPSLRKTKDV